MNVNKILHFVKSEETDFVVTLLKLYIEKKYSLQYVHCTICTICEVTIENLQIKAVFKKGLISAISMPGMVKLVQLLHDDGVLGGSALLSS